MTVPDHSPLGGLVVLVGGARSGKSRLAVDLAARWHGPVNLIATAEAGDDEMTARITRHKKERPDRWVTIEEPMNLARALDETDPDACVIVDCVTLWVANLQAGDYSRREVFRRTEQAIDMAVKRQAPTVVVSNEVGLGIVPATALGRDFRDWLGEVNQAWVEAARHAFVVVAGRPIELFDVEPRWEESR